MSPRYRDVDGLERNRRTLALDLELLVRVADVGGRLELSVEEDGRTLALLMTADNRAPAYGERGATPREAVKRLRDRLERLAAEKPRP
jgi:hypothetical protein